MVEKGGHEHQKWILLSVLRDNEGETPDLFRNFRGWIALWGPSAHERSEATGDISPLLCH